MADAVKAAVVKDAAGVGGAAAESAAAAGTAAATAGGGKGDLNAALRQEREKNRELRRLLEEKTGAAAKPAESATAAASSQNGNEPATGSQVGNEAAAAADFDITDDDIFGGDPKRLNSKVDARLRAALEQQRQQLLMELRGQQTADKVTAVLDEYEILRDEKVGRYASAAVEAAIRALPDGVSVEQVRAVIDPIARDFTAMRVGGTGGGAGARAAATPVAPGAGTAEATSLREPATAPGGWANATAKAAELGRQWLQSKIRH